MLKPFKDRVEATIRFIESVSEFPSAHATKIVSLRKQVFAQSLTQVKFPLKWELDSTGYDVVPFSGYKAKYKPSEVSGLPRLYYDKNEPWQREIKFFNNYKVVMEVQKPIAYIIPQAWKKIVSLLELNGVKTEKIKHDTAINVVAYTIEDFKTTNNAYEGHYMHSNIKTMKKRVDINFFEGDYLIYLNQDANRFFNRDIRASCTRQLFCLGIFDAILQQKEWYSDYVFEDMAAQILKENASLKEELKQKQIADTSFAKNAWVQLYFVYKNSPYFESSYRRYPVYRLE
ncbi:MAG: hypothetical protein IPJ79_05320 [Bacteroidetes bacterium]|nr:hypothetical protein [Bacteroidota bacterium]